MKQYKEEVRKYFEEAYDNIVDRFEPMNLYQYNSVADFAREGYIGGWVEKMFTYQTPVYDNIFPDDEETQKIWNEAKYEIMDRLELDYFAHCYWSKYY